MRADEYLVEEIIKLKKENEELKEKNIDLSLQLVNLNKSNENEIILNEKFKLLFSVDVFDSTWRIEQGLKNGKFEYDELNELLENDEKLDNFIYAFSGLDKEKAYQISDVYASHEIKHRNDKIWISVYANKGSNKVECCVFHNQFNFEKYEEALKYGREESRKVIKEVLDDYNRRKN